jgi:hypothetical protein
MTKLQMLYVKAFCHTTDINTRIQLVPDTPEQILFNTHNICCDTLLQIAYTYRTSVILSQKFKNIN